MPRARTVIAAFVGASLMWLAAPSAEAETEALRSDTPQLGHGGSAGAVDPRLGSAGDAEFLDPRAGATDGRGAFGR